jgi:hypothetical protein
MSSIIELNKDFESKKLDFNKRKEKSKTLNDKSLLYDDLLKDRAKNLKRLSRLMDDDKNSEMKFFETPLHIIVLKTITTLEKFIASLQKYGFKFKLNYDDKIYLGLACGVMSLLMLLLLS